jgi:hypothetical protein
MLTVIAFFSLSCQRIHSQSFIWQIRDGISGEVRFSVKADSIFGIARDVFAIRMKSETILIRNNPLQPFQRITSGTVIPLNDQFFSIQGKEGLRLQSFSNPGLNTPGSISEIQNWRKQILARTNENWVYMPQEGEYVRADSMQVFSSHLFLFQPAGTFWVDSSLKVHYFKKEAGRVRVNIPFFTYLYNGKLWVPLRGRGNPFHGQENAVWWNDTSLIDTSSSEAYLQTPFRTRYRLGEKVKVLNKNVLWIRNGEKEYLLFSSGKKIVVPHALDMKMLNESICALRHSGSWVIYHPGGSRSSVKVEVTEMISESEGVVLVKSGKRWGCTDLSGIIRISCRYDSLLPCKQGRIAARLASFWGFLDCNERITAQPNFDWVMTFSDSVTAVRRGKKWGLIRLDGTFLLECEFDGLSVLSDGKWLVQKGVWKGIFKPGSNFLLNTRYSDIIEAPSGFFQTEREGKQGLFNASGKVVLPVEFARILYDPKYNVLLSR